jgi:L-ribulose-5-phosphate 3-epimerase
MTAMSRIAIMQGRLLPPEWGRFQCFPRDRWREEFARAAEADLDAIEWIYDLHGADANPVATDEGIAEIRALSRRHAVEVVSMCADYFMDRPFTTATTAEFEELVRVLLWLLERCHLAGISRVVLPFVDASRIQTPDQENRIIDMLCRVLPLAEQFGVELHLETSLAPNEFASLLAQLPQSILKVNYDSGNSASLGYDVRREIAAYGPRIGSVHLKDRVRGGGTVALGQGDAEISVLLVRLASTAYEGDYVLQVARGEAGKEVGWAQQNRAFLLRHLNQANLPARRARQ